MLSDEIKAWCNLDEEFSRIDHVGGGRFSGILLNSVYAIKLSNINILF